MNNPGELLCVPLVAEKDESCDRLLFINNRKYLGGKYRLLPFLKNTILDTVKNIDVFIDGFAGTGVVAQSFLSNANKVIANDILFSNYVALKTFLETTGSNTSLRRIKDLIDEFNSLPPLEGYIFHHFGGTYFTYENAGLIDAIREKIDEYYCRGLCSLQENYILLTSLLYAVDKAANTVGQYDAFLKNLGRESYSLSGKHIVDSNVYKPISLKQPSFEMHLGNTVYCMDLNQLIGQVEGSVLYLDPPYNNRQYIDCYHVLENIILWNKPQLFGKTRKFEREHLKSRYSRKREAASAFMDLIRNARVEHIFLSYNNEGLMTDDIILSVLKKKGQVEIFQEKYNIFGNGAGKSVKRDITERLFYCRVY